LRENQELKNMVVRCFFFTKDVGKGCAKANCQ